MKKLKKELQNKLLCIKSFCNKNKYLIMFRIITIVIFSLLLFSNIHNFMVECFVENNRTLINQSVVSSKIKDDIIQRYNLMNIRSGARICDIILENESFSFVTEYNTNTLIDENIILMPKNDDDIVIYYVKELTTQSSELCLAIIFPLLFNLFTIISKKICKTPLNIKTMCLNESLKILLSLIISLILFYGVLHIYVSNWDKHTTIIQILLLINTLLIFIVNIFNKDEMKIYDKNT